MQPFNTFFQFYDTPAHIQKIFFLDNLGGRFKKIAELALKKGIRCHVTLPEEKIKVLYKPDSSNTYKTHYETQSRHCAIKMNDTEWCFPYTISISDEKLPKVAPKRISETLEKRLDEGELQWMKSLEEEIAKHRERLSFLDHKDFPVNTKLIFDDHFAEILMLNCSVMYPVEMKYPETWSDIRFADIRASFDEYGNMKLKDLTMPHFDHRLGIKDQSPTKMSIQHVSQKENGNGSLYEIRAYYTGRNPIVYSIDTTADIRIKVSTE